MTKYSEVLHVALPAPVGEPCDAFFFEYGVVCELGSVQEQTWNNYGFAVLCGCCLPAEIRCQLWGLWQRRWTWMNDADVGLRCCDGIRDRSCDAAAAACLVHAFVSNDRLPTLHVPPKSQVLLSSHVLPTS
jgi:hypothetical protein